MGHPPTAKSLKMTNPFDFPYKPSTIRLPLNKLSQVPRWGEGSYLIVKHCASRVGHLCIVLGRAVYNSSSSHLRLEKKQT